MACFRRTQTLLLSFFLVSFYVPTTSAGRSIPQVADSYGVSVVDQMMTYPPLFERRGRPMASDYLPSNFLSSLSSDVAYTISIPDMPDPSIPNPSTPTWPISTRTVVTTSALVQTISTEVHGSTLVSATVSRASSTVTSVTPTTKILQKGPTPTSSPSNLATTSANSANSEPDNKARTISIILGVILTVVWVFFGVIFALLCWRRKVRKAKIAVEESHASAVTPFHVLPEALPTMPEQTYQGGRSKSTNTTALSKSRLARGSRARSTSLERTPLIRAPTPHEHGSRRSGESASTRQRQRHSQMSDRQPIQAEPQDSSSSRSRIDIVEEQRPIATDEAMSPEEMRQVIGRLQSRVTILQGQQIAWLADEPSDPPPLYEPARSEALVPLQ